MDRIELLYDPPAGAEGVIDLVFVHGVLGDHMSAWTHPETKVHWPRDLLPKDFPNLRILAFKYSPTVEDFFPTLDLEKHPLNSYMHDRSLPLNVLSNELISAIYHFRRKSQRKGGPLILFSHSLGGLVCINALLRINNPHLEDIFPCIRGQFFLGTPFMDATDRRWLDVAVNILKLMRKPTDIDATWQKNFRADLVSMITGVFSRCGIGRDLFPFISQGVTYSYFCESLPVNCNDVRAFIVDEDAAVPPHDHHKDFEAETWGSASCIEADHISLCKYADAESEGYQKVQEELYESLSQYEHESGSTKNLVKRDSGSWNGYFKTVCFLTRF